MSTIVRCVTLNVAGVQFDWSGTRSGSVVRQLSALAPDVVCFQEAIVRGGNEPYNQASAVGEALGLRFGAFAPYGNPAEIASEEVSGLAVAARWPIAYAEARRLPPGGLDGPDPRVALLVRLLAGDEDVSVATVHLSRHPEQLNVRRRQLGVLLDYLWSLGLCQENARLVLAGDLNATENEPAIAEASSLLVDAYRRLHPDQPGFTWDRSNPLTQRATEPSRRLDYAFCPCGAEVQEAGVVLDHAEPVYPSDHYGLLVQVGFSR